MPDPGPRPPRISREMRLLLLTIVVSGAVLLLLARIRFPAPPPAVDAFSQPLQRLAARAPFEELAQQVSRVEAEVLSSLVVLRLDPASDAGPVRFADLGPGRLAVRSNGSHVAALRTSPTMAVAVIPPDLAVAGVVGQAGPSAASLVATDQVRRVSRIRVPEGPARPLPQIALSALRTPAYVIAVEGTRAGLTLRPVFLGRSERFRSSRWQQPLLPLGAASVAAGALMFTLDGEFLGCAVLDEGTSAIADAADFLRAGAAVEAGGRVEDPGLALQALTPALALALGVDRGVVVAEVDDGGPAASRLRPGDVIERVGAREADAPDAVLLDLAERLTAGPVRVELVRSGRPQTVTLERVVRPPAAGVTPRAALPVLRAVPGTGTRIVSLADISPLARAGLRAGDIVVAVDAIDAPSPAQVRAIAGELQDAAHVLVVRRGTRQYLAALGIPGLHGDARP